MTVQHTCIIFLRVRLKKKGAESVISFLYDCMLKELEKCKNCKSDACGGQNKNILMIYFGLFLPGLPYGMGYINISPGLPWKERRYATKRDVLKDETGVAEIHKIWSLVGKGYRVAHPDTMVYFRAQICDITKNKIRATWGYPLALILEEGRMVYPYLDWIRHSRTDVPVAYGIEMATGGMGYIDEAIQKAPPNAKYLMFDWKKFDKNIPPWLLRDAFDIVIQSFDFRYVKSTDGKIWPVDPAESKRRMKSVINYFINTPFVLPSGERYQKCGGVPSGSGFTNIIDTIVNAIVTRYCLYHVTGEYTIHDIYMGDDSFIIHPVGVDLDAFSSFAGDNFGFNLNTDKSYITSNRLNVSFLGYYNVYGRPIRSMDFLIASFILPERFHGKPDPEYTCVRAVGQMWSTFNGAAACRWLDLIEDMERHFTFDHNWYASFIEEHPSSLKYLRTGWDPSKIHVPRRGPNGLLIEVEPPFRGRRDPHFVNYNMETSYKDFCDKYKDFNFGLWFARTHNVDIHHIFPVKGHSFCQCDRNLGFLRTALENKVRITNVKSYLENVVL